MSDGASEAENAAEADESEADESVDAVVDTEDADQRQRDDQSEAAPAGSDVQTEAAAQTEAAQPVAATEQAQEEDVSTTQAPAALTGVHKPGDVVPTRQEPFRPARRPDHPEPAAPSHLTGLPSANQPAAQTVGSAAVATNPETALIERDPSVNRSLLLRLIAGVRGL